MLTTNAGSTTTYFVGTHYEVENGIITKYYYAGTQRIAMRQDGDLFFITGDHLGSTSLVTDASGAVINETQYKAWGETRYSSSTEQTKYTYTGQYSYTDDFGLMFYNARWYDPSLGRFAQADSLIPVQQGVQAWDRYAYANNSSLNYTDLSGHCIWDGCVVEVIALTVATVVIVSKAVEVIMFGTAPNSRGIGYAEQYVENTNDAMSTYTAAGIAIQSNYYPLGEIYLPGEGYEAGLGLAQVSQKELDEYLHMQGSDPIDPNIAVAAMQKRISMVINKCEGNCSSTDIFIAAALAQNGSGFTNVQMAGLVNGIYGTVNTSDPTKAFLPWGNFLDKIDNSDYYKLMIKMFKNDVLDLSNNGWSVPDDIDWDYIDKLSSDGWRSKIR